MFRVLLVDVRVLLVSVRVLLVVVRLLLVGVRLLLVGVRVRWAFSFRPDCRHPHGLLVHKD